SSSSSSSSSAVKEDTRGTSRAQGNLLVRKYVSWLAMDQETDILRCELCDTSDRNDGGARWNLKELAVPVLEASLSQHAKTVGHVWALSQKEGALRKCKEKDEPSCPIKYDIQNSDFFQFKQFFGRGRPTEIPAEFFEINTAFYSHSSHAKSTTGQLPMLPSSAPRWPDVFRSTTGEAHKDRKDVGVNKLIKKHDKSTHVCKSCKNSVTNQNKYCNYW
ncbi:hypothetical protein FOZ60_008927, partial [Perkinsus olseni]